MRLISKDAKNSTKIGMPKYMRFGVEVEVENVNYSAQKVKQIVKKLGWKSEKDSSLIDGGREFVSHILSEEDESNCWDEIEEICNVVKANPYRTDRIDSVDDKRQGAYCDKTCGGHVHFDASLFVKYPEMMQNFLKIWAESEELIYKMCNDKGDPIRANALESSNNSLIDACKKLLSNPVPKDIENKKTIKGFTSLVKGTMVNFTGNIRNCLGVLNVIVSDNLVSKNGMASPISQKIKEQEKKGNIKLGRPHHNLVYSTLRKNKLLSDRYKGLNLVNVGRRKQNTIEFRMSNGSIDPKVWKENIFLYASVIDAAAKQTLLEMPNEESQKAFFYEMYGDSAIYSKEEIDSLRENFEEDKRNFFNSEVTEEEKAVRFLKFIMPNEEDRQVYMDRWESVKDNEVFKNTSGAALFSTSSFKKEDFQSVYTDTPKKGISEMIGKFSQMIQKFQTQTQNLDKGEEDYAR